MYGLGDGEVHIAVEACAGVPAAALVLVVQAHGQHIALPRAYVVGDVEVEAIVAVGPVADLLPVDVDPRVAHRPVEGQAYAALPEVAGDLQLAAVPAHADEGQSPRAASMLHRLLLAILRDR